MFPAFTPPPTSSRVRPPARSGTVFARRILVAFVFLALGMGTALSIVGHLSFDYLGTYLVGWHARPVMETLTGLAVNPGLYGPKLPYDPQKDLVPVMLAASVASVVVVHPSVPVKTMGELAAYLKANPGKVAYASAGNGTPSHLGMEYYKRQNGVDPVHLPYKGGAPALLELVGGQVQLMMALVPEAMPHVKAGRLRALAVTAPKRLPAHPDVPTVVESGGKDFDMTFWFAFMAPAGTPEPVVAKLNQTLNTVLQGADVRAKLAEMSLDVAGGVPAKVTELMRSDAAKWKKVIDEAGIKVD